MNTSHNFWMLAAVATAIAVCGCNKADKMASTAPMAVAVQKPPKGYALTQKEALILDVILADEIRALSNGGSTQMGTGLVVTSSVDAAALYNENQVAGDQKFFKKAVLVKGPIASINSGIGNEPYLTMAGVNQFTPPQIHFQRDHVNVPRIAKIRRGEFGYFVCTGAGSVAGGVMFTHCQFADEFAQQAAEGIRSAVQGFSTGMKPSSTLPAEVATMAIAFARLLPDTSSCFTGDQKSCMKDLKAAMASSQLRAELDAATKRLNASGVEVSMKHKQ